ncbi:MAG: general secretion pathway protein GspB [Proteobacteria bacterium]|nr:general secretion pathway protein GspB [Pseudomonadota bacterium]
MSLILEALKKSEANRRLGQAPDLGTPFTPARRERNPLWALLVIIVALGFGAWWWFGGGSPAPAPANPPIAAQPAPTAASSIQASTQKPLSTPTEKPPAARAAPAGEQIWVAAQRNSGGPSRNATANPPPHMPPPAATAPPPVTAAPPKLEPVAAAPIAHPPAPVDAQTHAPAPQPHPLPGTAANPPATVPAAMPATLPKADVPSYYDLPFATRKALPPINLSMHVYTADPKQRFVMLDGARLAEGDTTTDNVTVREIRPDGVVFEFQGQRFFFPRGGL